MYLLCLQVLVTQPMIVSMGSIAKIFLAEIVQMAGFQSLGSPNYIYDSCESCPLDK